MSTTLRKTRYRGVMIIALLLPAAGVTPQAYADPNGPEVHSHGIVYEITPLPTFDGAFSRGSAINPLGRVAGFSDLAGMDVRRATLWIDGNIVDLGTLGEGGNLSSSVPWPGINLFGTVAGISKIDELDPLGQKWSCSWGSSPFLPDTGQICRGFAWKAGRMKEMPTLGGHNSYAAGINNRNQVVGWAETDIMGEHCDPDQTQVLTFHGVVWDPWRDTIKALPPYGNDEASAAVDINDRGQVVGISGDCDQAVGRFSARRAVMWDRDEIIDLGNLGGTAWHTPVSINARGQVVGFSNLPDDGSGGFNAQAFIWTEHDGMEPLGTLSDDSLSQANSINVWSQVVGGSCCSGPSSWRAVKWQNGEIVDLNTRITGDFAPHLRFAHDIDLLGRITGEAVDLDTGERFGFIATPKRRPFK